MSADTARQFLAPWLASFGDSSVLGTSRQTINVAGAAGQSCLRLTRPASSGSVSFAAEKQNGLIFDGWLYNRDRYLVELGLPAAQTSNALLILRAYLRWGERVFEKLRGIFAICLWDDRSKTLLAARDPAGVYPLFYAHTGREWLFSTSVDQLLQHPGVPKTINCAALATYLWGKYRDIEETFFSGIRRVPPGHALKLRETGTNAVVYRYWNPVPEKMAWLQEDELEEFPRIMKRAIGRCFQLGRAGMYLSGGLDSGTIATFATEYARENFLPLPHAVSLVYPDPEANEERIQKGLADALGIPQTLVPHEHGSPLDKLFLDALNLNATWPHPLVVGLSPLHLVLGNQAREKDCDLVLSGEGGDEWLAIHYRLAADFVCRLDFSSLCRLLQTAKATAHNSWYGTTRHVLGGGSRFLLQDGYDSLFRKIAPRTMRARGRQSAENGIPTWLAPDRDVRENLYARAEKAAERARGSFYQRDIMETILNQPLTVLYKEDNFECSRRTGVLMLEPFYDPDVIAFLVRMPPWLRGRGGHYKGLLRQILHQRFPQLGYDRQQKPYATSFFAGSVLSGARRLWPNLKGARALGSLGLVEQPSINGLVTKILDQNRGQDVKRLWMILCAEVWARSQLDADSVGASSSTVSAASTSLKSVSDSDSIYFGTAKA